MTNRNSVRGIIDIFQISDRTIISGVGCKHAVWSRSLPSLRSKCGVGSCKSCSSRRWLAMSSSQNLFMWFIKPVHNIIPLKSREVCHGFDWCGDELNMYVAGTFFTYELCFQNKHFSVKMLFLLFRRKQYIWTFSSSRCCVCEIVRSTDWKCQHLGRKYLLALQQNEQIDYHTR